MFSKEEAAKLKENCRASLRKQGVRSPNSGKRKRVRKEFSEVDDSKIREIKSPRTYWDWVALNREGVEPLEANPDLFEDLPEE